MQKMQNLKEEFEENKEFANRFKAIYEKISKYVNQKNGQLVQLQNFHSTFIFTKSNETFGDLKYYISCMLTGGIYLRIVVQIDLKSIWSKIKNFGICHIIQFIQNKNKWEKRCLVYEFFEQKMSIRVRMQSICSEISQYFFKLAIDSIQILSQIVNQIVSQKNNIQSIIKNKGQFLVSAIEELKTERQQSRPILKNQIPEIKKKDFGKRLEQLDSLVIKYKYELFEEFQNYPKILTCLKQLSLAKDEKWKKTDGSQSKVSKYYATVTISDLSSIHTGTNQALQKIRQSAKKQNSSTSSSPIDLDEQIPANRQVILKNSQQAKQNQYAEKQINIILIKKEPLKGNTLPFEAQKKILVYLRNMSCPSVNNYYCVQKKQLKHIQYIYSDYYENKISCLLKPKKLIKLILRLSQALLFFHENSIAHRDLKPDNILRTKTDEIKIIDFGSGCHTMSYLRRRSRNSEQLVQQQLYTNRQYNLIYSDLTVEVKQKILRQNFQKHNYFDLFAFGKIIHNFVKNQSFKSQMGSYVWQCLIHLSRICMQQYPNDRPDPQNIYAFLKQLTPYF